MKLALSGFFLCMAVVGTGIYSMTGDVWAALGGGAFALASIASSVSILQGYKGAKK